MASESVVDQIVNSLSFEVEAVPHQNVANLTSTSNSTPLNVKIRVRKKQECGIQQGYLSVPKYRSPDTIPERIRLISSDQTIMSFNVSMEADFVTKPKKKPRRFFGGCLGSQYDDDDTPYTPSTTYNAKLIDTSSSKSEGIIRQNFTLSKANYDNTDSLQQYTKKHGILGKCKPGGCLDPPFSEEKYSYEPIQKSKVKKLSITEDTKKSIEKIKLTKSVDNRDDTREQKQLSNDSLATKLKSKVDDNSLTILSLYDNSLKDSIDSKYSDSVITYPPIISPSDEKNASNRLYSDQKPRKSYDDSVEAFYTTPKKNKQSNLQSSNSVDDPKKGNVTVISKTSPITKDSLAPKFDEPHTQDTFIVQNSISSNDIEVASHILAEGIQVESHVPGSGNKDISSTHYQTLRKEVPLERDTSVKIGDPLPVLPIQDSMPTKDTQIAPHVPTIETENNALKSTNCQSLPTPVTLASNRVILKPGEVPLKDIEVKLSHDAAIVNENNDFLSTNYEPSHLKLPFVSDNSVLQGVEPHTMLLVQDSISSIKDIPATLSSTSVERENKALPLTNYETSPTPVSWERDNTVAKSDRPHAKPSDEDLVCSKDIQKTSQISVIEDGNNSVPSTNYQLLPSKVSLVMSGEYTTAFVQDSKPPKKNIQVESHATTVVSEKLKQSCEALPTKNQTGNILTEFDTDDVRPTEDPIIQTDINISTRPCDKITSGSPTKLANVAKTASQSSVVNSIKSETIEVLELKNQTLYNQNYNKMLTNQIQDEQKHNLKTQTVNQIIKTKQDQPSVISKETQNNSHISQGSVGKIGYAENTAVAPTPILDPGDYNDIVKKHTDHIHDDRAISNNEKKVKDDDIVSAESAHTKKDENFSDMLISNMKLENINVNEPNQKSTDKSEHILNKKHLSKEVILTNENYEEKSESFTKAINASSRSKIHSYIDHLPKNNDQPTLYDEKQVKEEFESPPSKFVNRKTNDDLFETFKPNIDEPNQKSTDQAKIEQVNEDSQDKLESFAIVDTYGEEANGNSISQSIGQAYSHMTSDNMDITQENDIHPDKPEHLNKRRESMMHEKSLRSNEMFQNNAENTLLHYGSDVINNKIGEKFDKEPTKYTLLSNVVSEGNSERNNDEDDNIFTYYSKDGLITPKQQQAEAKWSQKELKELNKTDYESECGTDYNILSKPIDDSHGAEDPIKNKENHILHRSIVERTIGDQPSEILSKEEKEFEESEAKLVESIRNKISTPTIIPRDSTGSVSKSDSGNVSKQTEGGDSVSSPKIRFKPELALNSQNIGQHRYPSRSSLKRDSGPVSLDFAFQSYINDKNERTIKSIDTSVEPLRYREDSVTVVQSLLRPNINEIRVPIDVENEMTIQIRRTKSPTQVQILEQEINDLNKPLPVLSKNFGLPDSENLFSYDSFKEWREKTSGSEIPYVLNMVYEQELVPLQKTINSLKKEIDSLATQQSILIEQFVITKKTKPVRLIKINSRCACYRN